MTVHELIENYREKNGGPFFDVETLRFFGEKISDMEVEGKKNVEGRDSWILRTYQRNAPVGSRNAFFAFDTETFEPDYLGTSLINI